MSDDESEQSVEEIEAQLPAEKLKELEDVRSPDVVDRYLVAAEICNSALKRVLAAAVAGASVVDLCVMGDRLIVEDTSKIFKGKTVTKGVGFPTCVSVNNVVGSFSPLASDVTVLKAGDVAKIDLGVHIDGYIVQAATTVVVGAAAAAAAAAAPAAAAPAAAAAAAGAAPADAAAAGPVTGRTADVIAAVFTAYDAVTRSLRPGVTNTQLTQLVAAVAEDFGVKPVEGVYSHEVKRFTIEGPKKVENAVPEVPLIGENRTKPCTLEANEVWTFDIVMSTGTGRPSQVDERTTVYRRLPDNVYQLKLQASRSVLTEVIKKHPVYPFSVRGLEVPEGKCKLGVRECASHKLLEPYPVLMEKDGDIVSHIKFTVLLLPNGTRVIAGPPAPDAKSFASDKAPKSELVTKALATPVAGANKKKKKAKAKAKAKKAAAAAAAAGAAPASN